MSFDPDQLRDLFGRWTTGSGIELTQHSSGRIHVKSPYDKGFIAKVKALGGTWSPKAKTWSVPGDQAEALDKALLDAYKPTGHGNAVTELSSLPLSVSIRSGSRGSVVLTAPYSNNFRLEAKEIGHWDSPSKAWVFPEHRRNDVEKLAVKHYGVKAGTPDPLPPARRTPSDHQKPTPRQVDYAMTLVAKYDAAGYWGDLDMNRAPTRAELADWTPREVSRLIDDIKEDIGPPPGPSLSTLWRN